MRWMIVLLLLGTLTVSNGQIEGRVFDENKTPLVGATILRLPDSIQTVSDETGFFYFKKVTDHTQYLLEISYIGYKIYKKQLLYDKNHNHLIEIQLSTEVETLETLVIEHEHAKQERTLSSNHLDEHFIKENMQGTFAKSIEKIAGVSAINVGVGIAKPVIRGLSSNRIIVNQQGIKQESHQWGADHGLEVDQFDVERVEIIKGPATLQYGSDGLGGVINIMPGRIIPKNSFAGSVEGVYKSNNDHWGGSALFTANLNDFFVSARYSRQDFGDYRVPTDQFTYNNFTLPIYDNTLKNTAGNEENIRISAGWKTSKSITRVLLGRYALNAGLFSGAVGVPRSYALTDDGNHRDIDIPKQEVDHYRASFHQTYFFGNDHLNINLGYQKNIRKEFSYPEFHNIPSSQIETDNTLALQFDLQTLSANIHYENNAKNGLKTIFGANVQTQNNTRSGFEFLLPDFQTFRAGLFTISEWSPREDWILNGGIRLDFAQNQTEFYRQWIWDSNENIIDSLFAPITNDVFFNWSASLGSNWHLKENWWLRANIAKSFRVPYPAETVSNGIHHGTFRHEVGTPDLKSEHGYQFDISVDWDFEHFSGNFSTYFNYFDNYIYLGPTFPARFSTLPEAGQVFQYRQDDAIYTGFELFWNWEIVKGLSLEQTTDFVQNFNIITGLALPFTPQPALKHTLRYDLNNAPKSKNTKQKMIEEWFIEVGHQYYFAATKPYRVDRTEQETPAYQLWKLGTGLTLEIREQTIQFNLQVQNLFNTYYLNHLSRYRLINIPEQGRNVSLMIKVPFSGDL